MINQEIGTLEMREFDFELESFEPIVRTRSNTWPLMPRPQCFTETENPDQNSPQRPLPVVGKAEDLIESSSFKRKQQLTRNAHGSSSYAELITQAISGAENQRLTLSEIYKWMIEHVPSIKDKEASTGWRNSVRHNLSLHKRFIRVPNETVGKSSWWMINPSEIFGKATRRRSASMEAKKYQKCRSRAKKNAQSVKSDTFPVETSTDLSQLRFARYTNQANAEQPRTAYAEAIQSQPIQNRCTLRYAYDGRLSPIPAFPNEIEAADYCHSYGAVVQRPLDNLFPTLQVSRPNPDLASLFVPVATPEVPNCKPANDQTLTRFNSFLDDVTDIISKEMTDCKLKIK